MATDLPAKKYENDQFVRGELELKAWRVKMSKERNLEGIEPQELDIKEINASNETLFISTGCGGSVVLSEDGNSDYAWFYLKNNSSRHAVVTICKQHVYNGGIVSKTERIKLYPGEYKSVFNMPRNQVPDCNIILCNLE